FPRASPAGSSRRHARPDEPHPFEHDRSMSFDARILKRRDTESESIGMHFSFLHAARARGTAFPLTPALSLGERGERHPPRTEAGRVNSSNADCGGSLSSGERAGVRGNRAYGRAIQYLLLLGTAIGTPAAEPPKAPVPKSPYIAVVYR